MPRIRPSVYELDLDDLLDLCAQCYIWTGGPRIKHSDYNAGAD